MNDKMDQIAVPSVVENAMENWGLLTYDPSFLLMDDAAAPSLGRQQLVAQVTAHEISHQWFGDTITNECVAWRRLAIPSLTVVEWICGGQFDIVACVACMAW